MGIDDLVADLGLLSPMRSACFSMNLARGPTVSGRASVIDLMAWESPPA